MTITNRQLEVLDFLKRYIANNGYPPTIREVAAGLNFKSPSSAQDHLKSLVLNGLITMDKQKSRTIELLVQNEYFKNNDATVKVPVLNNSYDVVNKEYIEIPTFMLNGYDSKNLYIFKKDSSYYIVNSTLKFVSKPSLIIKSGNFTIEDNPKDDIFGNIIGEYKIY